MKRREFIRNTTLFTSGVLLSSNKNISIINTKPKKVIILGAGIAGLGAAYQLQKMNIPYTILEARNRIGGRIFTHNITDDLTVELGAEWIGASHQKLIELCKELNLNLLNHQFNSDLILNKKHFNQSAWSYSQEWANKFEQLKKDFQNMSEAQHKKLDKTDWWHYLKQQGITDQELEIRELFDSTDFGETIRHVSAYAALSEYAESSPKNEMDYKIEGGNSRLIEALANKIGKDNIKTQHEITQIEQHSHNVKITCKNGTVWEADKVICTIPTYALSQINFSPSLPDDYIEALQSLQYARIIKTSVLFKERFWQREDFDMITDSCGHYFFHSTKNQKNAKGVLTSYAIGDKAYVMGKATKEDKIKIITDALEPAFGKTSHLAENAVAYFWGTDKYSYGAYALYGLNQWFSARNVLTQPFKNIHFAGEHLADWQGFMEGALESGIACAESL